VIPSPSVWILSDGKAGDEAPLLGIAEAMGADPVVRRVAPRAPWVWAMPVGPVPLSDRPGRTAGPLAGPFPDICLAAGRRSVAYLRALKAASPSTLTVYYRDPRTRRSGADLIVAQAHDGLSGDGVMSVVTGPHRLSPSRLSAARAAAPVTLRVVRSPRIAVLVGGDSRHFHWTATDRARLLDGLATLMAGGAGLMITASRRTPRDLAGALAAMAGPDAFYWDGTGDNPFTSMLALADSVVVTADSTNMIGEAAATGRPIRLFRPSGGHPKIDRFVAALSAVATIRPFPGPADLPGYAPVDSTPAIAEAVLSLWRVKTGR
jgi:mitochondrial fission protein ELM1